MMIVYTRTTHAYDASQCHVQMGRAAQVSGFARLMGAQRTVQKNDNMRSEPKYLAVKNLQYMLSTFELFLVVLLLSWLLQWADFFAFFSLRVASRQLCSALVYALGSTKYVRCEGPATLPPPPSSFSKKRHPDVIV